MTDKFLRTLKKGDVIEPLHFVMEDYESSDDPILMPVEKLTVNENTSFEEIDLGDGTFVMMFEMKDNKGKIFESEAVIINYRDGNMEIL